MENFAERLHNITITYVSYTDLKVHMLTKSDYNKVNWTAVWATDWSTKCRSNNPTASALSLQDFFQMEQSTEQKKGLPSTSYSRVFYYSID